MKIVDMKDVANHPIHILGILNSRYIMYELLEEHEESDSSHHFIIMKYDIDKQTSEPILQMPITYNERVAYSHIMAEHHFYFCILDEKMNEFRMYQLNCETKVNKEIYSFSIHRNCSVIDFKLYALTTTQLVLGYQTDVKFTNQFDRLLRIDIVNNTRHHELRHQLSNGDTLLRMKEMHFVQHSQDDIYLVFKTGRVFSEEKEDHQHDPAFHDGIESIVAMPMKEWLQSQKMNKPIPVSYILQSSQRNRSVEIVRVEKCRIIYKIRDFHNDHIQYISYNFNTRKKEVIPSTQLLTQGLYYFRIESGDPSEFNRYKRLGIITHVDSDYVVLDVPSQRSDQSTVVVYDRQTHEERMKFPSRESFVLIDEQLIILK
ncbi:hypothetical protein [Marinicrinis sediminis]|uniref:Uncharacterized protein n=1 Tax=Marinicrinis sediminis TaxID=1652465 RepID=A0ABW5R8P2_9BACL